MVTYFNEITTKEEFTLSVDMVRLVFKFNNKSDIEMLYKQLQFADVGMTCNLTQAEMDSTRPTILYNSYVSRGLHFGKYSTMFTIFTDTNKQDAGSFCLGVGLQNSRETMLQGFIEFNPNKCHGEVLEWFLRFLRIHCKYLCLKRYDLALDIPAVGSLIHIHKDQRKYELHKPNSNSDFDTEYLGTRNEAGRFKKYNKTEEHNRKLSGNEQSLEQDITRLELTLDSMEYKQCADLFPKIEIEKQTDLFEHMDYQSGYSKLSGTDKVLVRLLQESDKRDLYFQELTRDKKQKLRPFIYGYFHEEIIIHEEDFQECISKMKEYCLLFNSVTDILTA